MKTREARTKESTHLKDRKKTHRRNQYQERAGHYSARTMTGLPATSSPRCAREVGGKGRRTPLAYASHSTPRSCGSLAACLAHPSAPSFPGIPLCAGHQRISISTEGSRSRQFSYSRESRIAVCPDKNSTSIAVKIIQDCCSDLQ